MTKTFLFILIFMQVLLSCIHLKKQSNNDNVVARVQDLYLYRSEIDKILPDGINTKDSTLIARNYIDKWIRKKLLLKQAELNLTKAEKDVSKELEEYRSSLLTYKYQQLMLNEKLDTSLSKKDIENYYETNKINFLLNENYIKAIFIKLPLNAPDANKAIRNYRQNDEESIKMLEDYCYQYAKIFEYDDKQWKLFSDYSSRIPLRKTDNEELFLQNNKFIELKDTGSLYLLNIIDYRTKGMVSPLELVEDDIREILFNKSRIEFLQKLENEIYFNASSKNEFEIF